MTTRSLTLEQAQAQFVHRYTLEHVPAWARKPFAADGYPRFGQYPAPQYRTDRDWYENTVFPGEGSLSKRSRYCESNNPSWPLGQVLDKPL